MRPRRSRGGLRARVHAVDERLVHHLSTISVAAKPRTATVSNIIVPVGICAKKSINQSFLSWAMRPSWPHGGLAIGPPPRSGLLLIIPLIDDGSECYFLDNGERIRHAE